MSKFKQLQDKYWDNVWKHIELPHKLYYPNIADHNNIFNRILPKEEKRLIEVGCAPGRWLYHFNKYFAYKVTGIDYAPESIKITRKNLSLLGVQAEIIEGDFLEYQNNQDYFDIVFSAGFIEHFEEPFNIIKKFKELVKPEGGYIVTIIPNLYGLNGHISKKFRPHVFQGHNPISLSELISMHENNGFETLFSNYIGGYYIVPPLEKNSFSMQHPQISMLVNKPVVILNSIMQKIFVKTNKFPRHHFLSPMIMYIGRKKS